MKIRNILIASLLLLGACGGEDTDLIDDQREDIVYFLTSKHSPTLIAESEVAESLDDDPEFYSVFNNNTYRYIQDYYSADRESRTEAKSGDTLWITFWCYDFSAYTTPSDSYLYYTNDPDYEVAFQSAGLNTEFWSFEPQKIVLGEGDILNSIEKALVGCKEDDFVEIYLTYNAAYGSNWIGVTNLEEPIAFFCTIESIEN